MIKVTIWNENYHEKTMPEMLEIYPKGLHGAIADILSVEKDFTVRIATQDQPNYGLTDEILDDTDVLIWWGHAIQNDIPDSLASNIASRVQKGMGLIALHSSHYAKPFRALIGSGSCTLRSRNSDYERLWCVSPAHPIAKGIPSYIELGTEEVYCEHFNIPEPDELVFLGWYRGGEIFRSGCCWRRGFGKVFYFQPGHETFASFHNKYIKRILINAVRWACSETRMYGNNWYFEKESPEECLKSGKRLAPYVKADLEEDSV